MPLEVIGCSGSRDATIIPQMVEGGVLELLSEIYSSETDDSFLVWMLVNSGDHSQLSLSICSLDHCATSR